MALLTLAAATPASAKRSIMELPPFERAVLIIKKFETLHKPKHWPYVGYGHQVQPGEPYRRGCQLTEAQADALLRKDLRKFCALYAQYGKDSILLGCLAYNCGPGVVNKSTVLKRSVAIATFSNPTPPTAATKASFISNSTNVA